MRTDCGRAYWACIALCIHMCMHNACAAMIWAFLCAGFRIALPIGNALCARIRQPYPLRKLVARLYTVLLMRTLLARGFSSIINCACSMRIASANLTRCAIYLHSFTHPCRWHKPYAHSSIQPRTYHKPCAHITSAILSRDCAIYSPRPTTPTAPAPHISTPAMRCARPARARPSTDSTPTATLSAPPSGTRS